MSETDGTFPSSSSEPGASAPEQLPTTQPVVDDVSERLARLSSLHASGDLTDEEFAQAKQAALAMQNRPQIVQGDEVPVQGGRQRGKLLGALVALLVLAAVGFGLYSILKPKTPHETVHGTFEISNGSYDPLNDYASPNYQDAASGGCEGGNGYDDLNSITQVVVKSDKSKEVDRTELGDGKVDSALDACIFHFTFTVAKGPKYFVVSVGKRGESKYTFEELGTDARIGDI